MYVRRNNQHFCSCHMPDLQPEDREVIGLLSDCHLQFTRSVFNLNILLVFISFVMKKVSRAIYCFMTLSIFADVTMFPCFCLCPRQFYSQSGKYIGYLYVDRHVSDTTI